MTRKPLIHDLLLISLACLALFLFACGGGGDASPIVSDGDTDSDTDHVEQDTQADGDTDSVAEQEELAVPDGDESEAADDTDTDAELPSDGDTDATTESGIIRGTVHLSDALKSFPLVVVVFSDNPFVSKDAKIVGSAAFEAGQNTHAYEIKGLEDGNYYVTVSINAGDAQSGEDNIGAAYPEKVTLVNSDPALRVREGIDIYADVADPQLGSIAGTLHLSPAYQDKQVIVLAVRVKDNQAVEMWPYGSDYTSPSSSETRSFLVPNLKLGEKYYLAAFVRPSENQSYYGYLSPHAAYAIGTPGQLKYENESFYIGKVDPAYGSVSGSLKLPKAVSGGAMAIYVVRVTESSTRKETPLSSYVPETVLMVKKDDSASSFAYEVGNLRDGETIQLVGILKLDDTHTAYAAYPQWWKAETLTISYSGAKHQTGKDINIPYTELTGTLTVSSSKITSPAWATLSLMTTSGSTITDFGGSVTVNFESSRKGSAGKAFAMFPVKGGSAWKPVVIIGEHQKDGNGNPLPDKKVTCTPPLLNGTISVDGTARNVSKDISVSESLVGWTCTAQ